MRIIQLTDLHIGHEREDTYGIDVRSNFLNILAEAKFLHPDYLIITGDLCYRDGELSIYKWIKDRLDKTDLTYYIIPGNHDDTQWMREVFEFDFVDAKKELYYALKLEKQTCLFMDSSRGYHSKAQLRWLERQLKQSQGSETLIFTHHPPLEAGVKFMDSKHALKDQAAIQQIFAEHPDSIHLFCGHYHVDKNIYQGNLHVHITPSCFVQIKADKATFEPDHHQIALRIIDVNSDNIQTTIRYFDGQKM